jgi:hypothetical protein
MSLSSNIKVAHERARIEITTYGDPGPRFLDKDGNVYDSLYGTQVLDPVKAAHLRQDAAETRIAWILAHPEEAERLRRERLGPFWCFVESCVQFIKENW